MEPTTTSSLPYQNDDASSSPFSSSSWELRHDDDGFVYRRRRRKRPRLLHDEPPSPPSTSAADLHHDDDGEARRREWKEGALRKLKSQYEAEIEIWELLATRLKAIEDKTAQIQQRRRVDDETASLDEAVESEARCSESVLDELLLQAETEEAIIVDVMTLCDTVEAMCGAQEEDRAQSLIDLPVWGSPRELMKSLCD